MEGLAGQGKTMDDVRTLICDDQRHPDVWELNHMRILFQHVTGFGNSIPLTQFIGSIQKFLAQACFIIVAEEKVALHQFLVYIYLLKMLYIYDLLLEGKRTLHINIRKEYCPRIQAMSLCCCASWRVS